jgi:hypothetical protein
MSEPSMNTVKRNRDEDQDQGAKVMTCEMGGHIAGAAPPSTHRWWRG